MVTDLQKNILEFARRECFHATLKDFIDRTGVSTDDAVSALRDLKRKRIVSLPPDILNSWIGVTNYGWRVMGWKKY